MRKVGRDYQRLGSLDLFALVQGTGRKASCDLSARDSFLKQVHAGLGSALGSESTLHGRRAQALFQAMVVSLGQMKLVKDEDAGDCFYEGDELRIPDFRTVSLDGSSLLIETKNYFSKAALHPFKIRRDYVNSLKRFSALVNIPLRLAIYWAHWNQWTLNDPDRFEVDGDYLILPLENAFRENEMAALGDMSIGTRYPLELRIIASKTRPRSISRENILEMTIGAVEIRCAGELVEKKLEQQIALYLMMYGGWSYTGGLVENDLNGLPEAVVHTVQPNEPHPGQGFEIVGALSSIFSNLFNSVTLADDNRVTRLIAFEDPSSMVPIIPLDYKGEALPLWRFKLQPSHQSP